MNPVNIAIYSDLICPWCYIGQRRLRDGLKLLGTSANEVDIHWKAFQLNPDLPVEGLNRKKYRSAKFGSWERSQAMDAQVVAVGNSLGLSFNCDKVQITPNTFKGHRLIWWSRRFGKQDQVAVALLEAYFSNGLDVGNSKVLAEIAATVGISGKDAAKFLASEEGVKEVMEEEKEGRIARRKRCAVLCHKRAAGVFGRAMPGTILRSDYECRTSGRKMRSRFLQRQLSPGSGSDLDQFFIMATLHHAAFLELFGRLLYAPDPIRAGAFVAASETHTSSCPLWT